MKKATGLIRTLWPAFRLMFLIALPIALIIALAGAIYSTSKVPFPYDRVPVFPADKYVEASAYFDKNLKFELLGVDQILPVLMESAKDIGYQTNMESYLRGRLGEKLQNELVLVVSSSFSSRGSTIGEWSSKIDRTREELARLRAALATASYLDRQEAALRVEQKQTELQSLEKVNDAIMNARLRAPLSFPGVINAEEFSFVAGRYEGISISRLGIFEANLKDARPVFELEFLRKSGVPEDLIKLESLRQESDKLNVIRSKAERDFEINKDRVMTSLRFEVARRRAIIREDVYRRWYTVQATVIMSFMMFMVLLRYYQIVRRKTIPKKATFDVYYATNITANLIRWIALAIIVIGILLIFLNTLLVIIVTGMKLNEYQQFIGSIFNRIPIVAGLFYGILVPVGIAVYAIIASWIFVLWSEAICFITNCYDVMFKKAYKEEKIEFKDSLG